MTNPQPVAPSNLSRLVAPGGSNMPCECGGATFVLDSRGSGEGTRRRRQCKVCRARFTTYEQREGGPRPVSRDALAIIRRVAQDLLDRIERLAAPTPCAECGRNASDENDGLNDTHSEHCNRYRPF